MMLVKRRGIDRSDPPSGGPEASVRARALDFAAVTDRSRQRSPLAMVVLALLAEAPMHVYRMHELIKQRAKDGVVNVAQRNSVYQTIERLVRAELVRVEGTSRDVGRPERVVYEITEDGRETLEAWLKDMLARPANEFPELPAALAFLMVLAPSDARAQLENRCVALEREIGGSVAQTKAALAMGIPRLFLIEDEYRQCMLRAELEWVTSMIEDLRAKKLVWSREWLRKVEAKLVGAEPAKTAHAPKTHAPKTHAPKSQTPKKPAPLKKGSAS